MDTLRLATYNVHRCRGVGGRRDVTAQVRDICMKLDADLLALQELDAPESDDDLEAEHNARDLAVALGMQLLFCRTLRRGVGTYGHALLSRHPLALVKAETLPAARPGHEPRGAIWARATLKSGTPVNIVSTHLGTHRSDRLLQTRELCGPSWLGHPERLGPTVLCGDLNAVAGGHTHRTLSAHLRDAQRQLNGQTPQATFPAVLPLLRIDHVFVSDQIRVRNAQVLRSWQARSASDHLPLVVDLEVGHVQRISH